jgi:16S rRNA (guanine966-N2)-methyltransferase
MVGQDLSEWTVLDVFGGSGLLSLEALSRGAASALVLEVQKKAVVQIRDRAARFGAEDRLRVVQGRAPADLPSGNFDLVLLDPPYALDPQAVLAATAPLVSQVLVLEVATSRALPAEVEGLVLERDRVYGDTRLLVYRPG